MSDVRTKIWIDKKVYAHRHIPFVPRIGETFVFHKLKGDFVVSDIIWDFKDGSSEPDFMQCNVFLIKKEGG